MKTETSEEENASAMKTETSEEGAGLVEFRVSGSPPGGDIQQGVGNACLSKAFLGG